jgi:hypothetical protein
VITSLQSRSGIARTAFPGRRRCGGLTARRTSVSPAPGCLLQSPWWEAHVFPVQRASRPTVPSLTRRRGGRRAEAGKARPSSGGGVDHQSPEQEEAVAVTMESQAAYVVGCDAVVEVVTADCWASRGPGEERREHVVVVTPI